MIGFVLAFLKSTGTGTGDQVQKDLEAGYDIRTIQELLGHRDVSTTMR